MVVNDSSNDASARVSPQSGPAGPVNAEPRLIVVANRLPVKRVERENGPEWVTSPGGLVSALAPLIRERGGTWIGWDGDVHDCGSRATPCFHHDGMDIQPIHLTEDEIESFYEGFSNKTLWPLYHDALRFPAFHRHWWRPYRTVNERFARAVAELAQPNDLVWVHDYQLQLVPGMVRELLPHARIGFFLHIPFPPLELFAKLPWRTQILESLLGADVVGFQTKLSSINFTRSAKRYTRTTGDDVHLRSHDRAVRADAYPISIDSQQIDKLARTEGAKRRAAAFRESLGGRRIVLGVDRLDYTKGIDTRLRAWEELLERETITPADAVFVQIAVPTREKVSDYAALRQRVEELVGRINGKHATLDHIAVHYVYRGLPFEELVAAYAAADVMVVTPFRDGMNLVAKEYVAARTEDTGVLVLSEFAGAALELEQAMMVNPYDIDGLANTLERALQTDPDEAANHMRSMRRTVLNHDVYTWAKSFLSDLRQGQDDHDPPANGQIGTATKSTPEAQTGSARGSGGGATP